MNTDISVTQFIRSDAETLFDYWLNPEKIKTWIFPSGTDTIKEIKTDARTGGRFSFVIERDGKTIEHLGEYLTIDKPRKLVFSWAVADEEGSDRASGRGRVRPARFGHPAHGRGHRGGPAHRR
jgi:uncharacterized protein YndB with AHSA1/START domain